MFLSEKHAFLLIFQFLQLFAFFAQDVEFEADVEGLLLGLRFRHSGFRAGVAEIGSAGFGVGDFCGGWGFCEGCGLKV